MELRDLRAWPISATSLRRSEHGFNNETYFVGAREGEYVARIYRNTTDPSRVRDEHDLLARLALQELPFRVPVPLRSIDGDTLAVLETADGPRLVALTERIPGEPATLDVPSARLAGRALAQLDGAFSRLDRPVRPPAELRHVHVLVPDPVAALDDLDIGAKADPVRAVLQRVIAEHDALVSSLPRQLIHGDFAFPNVLIEGRKVTGMLDFEFAGADHRAAEVACALYLIAVRSTPEETWPVLDAFLSGFRRALSIDPLEAAALPSLMLRRASIGLVHWIGRWRQGIAPRDEPLARIDRTTRFARWLETNEPRVALAAAGEDIPTPRR